MSPKPVPEQKPSGDRRKLIAKTALTVLATRGARGLTHRAVDQEAGLPPGSTSYYCRTRAKLIEAAAEHLFESNARDAAAAAAGGGIRYLLEHWTSSAHHDKLVARFELFLDATRNPTTRALMHRLRTAFLRTTQTVFERAGFSDAELRGYLLVAAVDGLLLSHLLDAKLPSETLRQGLEKVFFEAE